MKEMDRLCGSALAEQMSEMTVEDVERHYGVESAKLYRSKLEAERRG
jgi:hypothetical protein